jgi:hypothetical protein
MFESNTALGSASQYFYLKIQIHVEATALYGGTNFCVCRSLRYCYHKSDDLPRRPVITMTIISLRKSCSENDPTACKTKVSQAMVTKKERVQCFGSVLLVRNENGFWSVAYRRVVVVDPSPFSPSFPLCFPFSYSKYNQSSSDDGDEKRAFSASVSVLLFGMRTDRAMSLLRSIPFSALSIFFNRRTKHRPPMVLFSLLHSLAVARECCPTSPHCIRICSNSWRCIPLSSPNAL